MKDRLYFIPHTHYDAAVFKTRAEYLEMGLPLIVYALQCLRDDLRYRFVLDQVCYIKPFLERYPEQEAVFREFVAQGRLQIVCGMDSMADVNIPSGESFIRQVLYGKGYCQDKLGLDVTTGWALDTFGHHPQMPQLLRQAGFDCYYFFRGAPSVDTPSEFMWEGIDGSQVLAFWLPYSYGYLFGSPKNLPEFAQFMRQRYASLKPFAATRNVLGLSGIDLGEPEPHVPALAEAFNDGAPPFEIVVATPAEFEEAFKAGIDPERPLQVIKEDLNPIFQGCYSSRIEVKQWNRELERLLTTVEKLDALAAWAGLPTDGATLARAWEPVLFSQFHDQICGVQMDKVFDDTMRSYYYCNRLGGELIEERLRALTAEIDTRAERSVEGAIPLIVWNTLAWERSDVATVEVSFVETGVTDLALVDGEGEEIPLQVTSAERHPSGGLRRATILFVARNVPSMGYAVYHLLARGGAAGGRAGPGQDAPVVARISEQDRECGYLENDNLRLTIDLSTGALRGLYLKGQDWQALRGEGAELGGLGNVVARQPDGGDFWRINGVLRGDIAIASDERHPAPREHQALFSSSQVGAGRVQHGPVMAEFAVSHPFGSGYLHSQIRLYAGLGRVDLHTELLNNEEWVRYRVLFPTTIREGKITHEIPFGAIERPPQELPAQNWIDYGDGQHGLALLNRGLPGNNVDEGVMMLSLSRASALVAYGYGGGNEPGLSSSSGQEKGKWLKFDYALLPHAGAWQDAQVYRAGLEFNNPLIVSKSAPHPGRLAPRWGLVQAAPGSVVVSALKVAQDGALVVRVYEAEGKAVTGASLRITPAPQRAQEADLLERDLGEIRLDDGTIRFDLGAFEIKTFKLYRAEAKTR